MTPWTCCRCWSAPAAADRGDLNHTGGRLARAAKLAGAPASPAAGLLLHCALGDRLEKNQVLFELHADTPGELDYALSYVQDNSDIFEIAP